MSFDYSAAYRVLRRDPVMKKIILHTGKLEPVQNTNLYFSLLHSIACQQLSTRAGDTIFGRFLDLFPDRVPAPELLAELETERLRGAGLSYAKASYLKNIAEFSMTRGLDYRKLRKLEDDALIGYLTSIKGVGRWTAEMILMFSLNRPDILPLDDAGIRNEMKRQYRIRGEGKKFAGNMIRVAEQWRPFRTLACRHLWRFRDA